MAVVRVNDVDLYYAIHGEGRSSSQRTDGRAWESGARRQLSMGDGSCASTEPVLAWRLRFGGVGDPGTIVEIGRAHV